MASKLNWKPASILAGVATPTGAKLENGRVFARELTNLSLATVLVRKGQAKKFAAQVKKLYGLEPPTGPSRAASGPVAFVATGPGAWMAVKEGGDIMWPQQLAEELKGLASVMDQSDGYTAIRVEGPAVLETLAKGVFQDLHISAFPVGAAAGASVAHIGVILWRREVETFEFLTFRSYAPSFWHWLEESAVEYGFGVLPPAV